MTSLNSKIFIFGIASILTLAGPSLAGERFVCVSETGGFMAYSDNQWVTEIIDEEEVRDHYVVELDGPSVTQTEIIWSWEPRDCRTLHDPATGEASMVNCANNGNTLIFSANLSTRRFMAVSLSNGSDYIGTTVATGYCSEVLTGG
ncbi:MULTISPECIES: hypothetical protein [unclassified Roseobacter]|uniref:hypothetical protein n=1 Tax=unclassified Roseobacter TaxID=196798 RepID=UPI0030ED27C8